MSKVKNEKKKPEYKNIKDLMKDLQGKFGEGSIMTLGDAQKVDVEVVPTGSYSLNAALGVGGLPKGRITEIYGPEGSGKTTLALTVVANAQKQGGKAAFIDVEHALDPDYAQRLGVNINELMISQPDGGEEALNLIEALIRSGLINIIIVDSVAALVPKAEVEGEMGQQFMGLHARMMNQALRKIVPIANKHNVLIIFINQIRMKLNLPSYMNPETTPGGNALKFATSVRIDIRRAAHIKKGEEIIGSRVRCKVIKNKVAVPFKIAEFDIMYGAGINFEADLIEAATKLGIITKTGNTYSYQEEKIGVGLSNASENLKEMAIVSQSIQEECNKAICAQPVDNMGETIPSTVDENASIPVS